MAEPDDRRRRDGRARVNRYWDAGDDTELFAAVSYVFDRVLGVEGERD